MISIIWTTIKERKWSVVIYSAISALFLLLYVALFPSLQSQTQALTEVLKTMPEGLLKALGSSPSQLSNFTIEALLGSKQFSMFFQLFAAILAFGIAASDLSGEVENGTIEYLLSQPVSRLKLYFARFISGLILLTIFVAASTLLVMPMAAAFHVAYVPHIYWQLFFDALLFTMALYSFAYFLSALFSNKGRVIGIATGVFAIMYGVFIVSALKKNLDKIKYASLFHYFPGEILNGGGIDKLGVWIFLAIIIVFTTLGAIIFKNRDIAIS
jgi:ABC-2 type transport system permease protein